MHFGINHIQRAVHRISHVANDSHDELNLLDGKLGDGDLGITLSNGWKEAAVQELPVEDMGKAFLTLSKAFQRVSSSSYGTLVATGLMAAAKAMKGRTSVDYAEISDILASARDAMMTRGKGELGQKSVLDIIDAAASATTGLNTPEEIALALSQSVQQTLDRFREQRAGLGRARMYGDASVGLDDPGMIAFQRMLEGLLLNISD